MTDDLQRLETLFQRAADLEPRERDAFLEAECAGDEDLRTRLEGMLRRLEVDDSLNPAAPEETSAGKEGPGSVIGRYKLLQEIGEGGYGTVYMAEQTEPVVRKVALKVIKPGMDSREIVARFEAERQALAMMEHPAIARVLDGGTTDSGRPYFVMELVRGVSITRYCDENRVGTRERLLLFQEVCRAVHHAHQKGIIHRDIKPSNVMVTLHDGHPTPKVIDFGIAKAMHVRLTDKTLFTEYQRFIGTPAYMSPEQAQMSALDVDTRADIYSLGVLLYELLTGTTPFDPRQLFEKGLAEVQRVIRDEEPQRPSQRISTSADATIASSRQVDVRELTRRVRGDLDWIVMKALEKDRTRRYDSASELAEEVTRHLDGDPVLAGPPSTTYRLRKLLRKNRTVVAWAGLLFLALVGGIVGTSLALVQAEERRKDAEREAANALASMDFLVETLALADPEIALAPELSVRDLLDRASDRLGERLAQQPRSEARVRIAMGRAYESLGAPEPAKRHLLRGIELAQGAEDYDRSELYTALWRLTHVLFVLEEPDALTTAQEARRVAHDHIRSRHPDLAGALDRFVLIADELVHSPQPERVAAVQAAFQETVRLSDEELPVGDPLWPIVSHSYHHAGYDLWFSPLESQSIPFWSRSLEIERRELGPGHPELAATLSQFTGVLNRAGLVSQAEEAIRESLEVVRATYPEDGLKVALTRSALGENLVLQERYEEAEPHLVDSHAVILATTDADNFFPADSFRRVLQLYTNWGREEEARSYRAEFARVASVTPYLQPFEIARWCFGPEHAEVVAHMERMRELCGDVTFPIAVGKRTDPAILPTAREVIAASQAAFEPAAPLSLEVARHCMAWAHELDPSLESEAQSLLYREAARVLPALAQGAPNEAAESHAHLAEILRRENLQSDAREQAELALAVLEAEPPPRSWFGAAAELRIARRLIALGLYAAAEPMIVNGHGAVERALGTTHSKTSDCRALARDLYEAWQRPELAARYAEPGD